MRMQKRTEKSLPRKYIVRGFYKGKVTTLTGRPVTLKDARAIAVDAIEGAPKGAKAVVLRGIRNSNSKETTYVPYDTFNRLLK